MFCGFFLDLKICRISPDNGPAYGGTDIIMLCEKIQKNDIEIRFFVKDANKKIIWESFGRFNPIYDIHKQVNNINQLNYQVNDLLK